MSLKYLPLCERPRERLLIEGESSLSPQELLAILLGSGTKGKSVLQLAGEVLHHFGGLKKLFDASIEELMEIKGIGKAKAIQLRAVLALARRGFSELDAPKVPIRSSKDAYLLLKADFDDQKQEMLGIVLIDIRGNGFHKEIIGKGTLTEVMVHPREVFHYAVRHKAYRLIIAHNHPSGDPTPSHADIQLTHLLITSSKVMGIELSDHLIIGSGAFVSLRELGIIK